MVRQYPTLFDTIEEDFACHYKDGKELLTGTLFFNNCKKSIEFVNNCIDLEEKEGGKLSAQTCLPEVIEKTGVSVYRLPAPYTLIFDRMKHQGPPVIEHFQASRDNRK